MRANFSQELTPDPLDLEIADRRKHLSEIKPLRNDITSDNVRIACQIGAGKFSDVFLVLVDADSYALKIFKPWIPQRRKEEESILLELTKFKVPNIPRLVATLSVSDPSRDAFLTDLIYEKYHNHEICKLSTLKKLRIIRKILITIQSASDLGIIHGNICPNNIVVDSSLETFDNLENVLLVGWSHAIRAIDKSNVNYLKSNKTKAGGASLEVDEFDPKIYGGNCHYKSPELLVRKDAISNKVDIWSIGCVLAFYLLGEPLWKQKPIPELPEPMQVLYNIAENFKPRTVLDECKGSIPPVHVGYFSRITMTKDPYHNLAEKIAQNDGEQIGSETNNRIKDFLEKCICVEVNNRLTVKGAIRQINAIISNFGAKTESSLIS